MALGEQQRFVLELGKMRGFLWADEIPAGIDLAALRDEEGEIEIRNVSGAGEGCIRVPDLSVGSPIERVIAQGIDHEDNEERLQDLEAWRCVGLAIVLLHGVWIAEPDDCDEYINPLLDDELVSEWPAGVLAKLTEAALGEATTPFDHVPKIQTLLDLHDVPTDLVSRTVYGAARSEFYLQNTNAPWAGELGSALKELAAIRAGLLVGNLRLVYKWASQRRGNLALSAALRSGLDGLNRALDKFETRRGNQLSTYATWWIRQAIDRASKNYGASLRAPVHVEESCRRLFRLKAETFAVRPGEPFDFDGLSERWDGVSHELRRRSTFRKIAAVAERPTVSHWVGLGGFPIVETLTDPDWEALLDLGRSRQVFAMLVRWEEELRVSEDESSKNVRSTNRARDVVSRRTGLGRDETQTLEQVGQEYNVTRERIRQIEVKEVARILGDWPELVTHVLWYRRA